MADPVYDDEGIDLITLTFAVVLAAAIVFLLAQIVPQLTDLMMMPPPLSGDTLIQGALAALDEMKIGPHTDRQLPDRAGRDERASAARGAGESGQ